MSWLGLVLVFAVAILTVTTGVPAYVVLLAASVIGAVTGVATGTISPDVLRGVASRLFNLLESDLLQALPLFLLTGALLRRLPVTTSLFKCGVRLLGGRGSSPAMSGLLIGALLGPMNGSVGASVGALARILSPELKSAGVAPATREAIVAVGGTLGVVVPPSLVLILLGDAMLNAHTLAVDATGRLDRVINTQDLMRGALLPAAIFIALSLVCAAFTGAGTTTTVANPTRREAVTAALSLAFLVTLLAGVATGRFYAVEAAAMAAVTMLGWAFASGRLSGAGLRSLLDEVLIGTGTLFAPLFAATTFTLLLRLLGTDKLVETSIASLGGGQMGAVLAILGCLALLAFALDAFEIIFVAIPILMPPLLIRVADAAWIGVLVLLVLQMSFLLPPMGYAWVLSRAASTEKAPASETFRALLPYLAAQVTVLALVVAWPALVHMLDAPGAQSRAAPGMGDPGRADAIQHQLPAAGTPGAPKLGTEPPRF